MTEEENTINGKERTGDVLVKDRVSFEYLFLSQKTLDGLRYCKFHKPSPIQLKAIPLGKCGFDLILKSKSGTGKTAVFAVIALEMINLETILPQVLILAPTREIAFQITGVIKDLGKFYEGLKVDHFIGGLDVKADIAKVNKCHIIVGTPGRVKHLVSAKNININAIKLLVLDEADKLLCDSFQGDINYIFNSLLKEKQIIASSATYPDKLDVFVSKYMMSPTYISPEVDSPLLLGIKQFVSIIDSNLNIIYQMKTKNKEIQRILSGIQFSQCLIFCNYQSRAESMCNTLNQTEWKAAYITASQSQEERLQILKNLKELKCRILFSSDLTARGIDAVNVDLVINCDVPYDTSTYLHRMGRAGRYGAKGVCITLATKGDELLKFQNILGTIGGSDLSVAKLPSETLENILEKKIEDFEQIPGIINENYVSEEAFMKDNIKKSILELKKHKVDTSSNVSEEIIENECDENVDVIEEVQIEDTKMDVDLQQLLMNLAEGKTPEISDVDLTDNKNKRKRNGNKSKDVDKRKVNENVLQKNIALLDVARILNDDDDIGLLAVNSLNHLMDEFNKGDEKLQPKESSDLKKSDVENIFVHAYNYAVNSDVAHWTDAIGDVSLIEEKQDECMDQYNFEDYPEEGEYNHVHDNTNYDQNMEPKTANDFENTIANNSDVNVRFSEQELENINYYKGSTVFKQQYDHLSSYLMEESYKFENDESFREWFPNWQHQVSSLTNYVQQNIYLQEMNLYQYYKNQ